MFLAHFRIFHQRDRAEGELRAQKRKQGPSFRRVLSFCFVFLLLIGACAKQPPRKGKPSRPKAAVPGIKVPPLPEALNPRREASQKMVEAGKEYLETGQTDKAVHTFQEAINVDSENGVAYYFLARALVKSEAFDEALGLLDQADTLLASNHDWRKEVVQLRAQIEETKAGKILQEEEKKKEEQGGYY